MESNPLLLNRGGVNLKSTLFWLLIVEMKHQFGTAQNGNISKQNGIEEVSSSIKKDGFPGNNMKMALLQQGVWSETPMEGGLKVFKNILGLVIAWEPRCGLLVTV